MDEAAVQDLTAEQSTAPSGDIDPRSPDFQASLDKALGKEPAPPDKPAGAEAAKDETADPSTATATAKPDRDPATGQFTKQETKEAPPGEWTPELLKPETRKQFNRLLQEKRELEARLREQQSLKPTQQPAAVETKPEATRTRPERPKWDTFDGTYEQYETAVEKWTEDLADWKAEQQIQAYTRKSREEADKVLATVRQNTEAQAFTKYRSEAEKARPDFGEVVKTAFEVMVANENDGFNILPEWGQDGAEMLYTLGKDPDLIIRLSRMHPAETIAELAVMRHNLKASSKPVNGTPAKRTVTEAPPPETQLGGTKVAPVDPERAAVTAGDVDAMIRLERERMNRHR